jgi:branched-chain amino acid transport system substrate-binding protein
MSTTTRKPAVLRCLIAAAVVASATVGCSSPTGPALPAPATGSGDVFGPVNRASGETIKIGWLGNGQTSAPSEATQAAVGVAGYANTYLGGLAGRSIQVVACEEGGTVAGAQACADQFVAEGVVAVGSSTSAEVDTVVSTLNPAGIPLVLNLSGTPSVLQTPGVFLLRNPMSVYGTPAAYARDNNLASVVIMVPDVPGATQAARGLGTALFANSGSTATVVAPPIGAADLTPQVTAAQRDNPAMWLVLGDATFCTAAITAIRGIDAPGKILSADICIGSDNGASIPGGLDGIDIVAQAVIDPADAEYARFTAVREVYGNNVGSGADAIGGYQTMLSLIRAVNATPPATLTPATATAALRQSPPIPYPLGGGVTFRCDGQAIPQISPNICSVDGLLAKVNPNGSLSDVRLIDTADIYQLPNNS